MPVNCSRSIARRYPLELCLGFFVLAGLSVAFAVYFSGGQRPDIKHFKSSVRAQSAFGAIAATILLLLILACLLLRRVFCLSVSATVDNRGESPLLSDGEGSASSSSDPGIPLFPSYRPIAQQPATQSVQQPARQHPVREEAMRRRADSATQLRGSVPDAVVVEMGDASSRDALYDGGYTGELWDDSEMTEAQRNLARGLIYAGTGSNTRPVGSTYF